MIVAVSRQENRIAKRDRRQMGVARQFGKFGIMPPNKEASWIFRS
jgi:hypothetical protein